MSLPGRNRLNLSAGIPGGAHWRWIQAIALTVALLIGASAAQSAEEWVRHFNGPGNGNDAAIAIAADTNGNVFVTGLSFGSSGTGFDFATLKYSPTGVPLWTNRYNGPGSSDDQPAALGVDPAGDVVVFGSSISGNGFYDYAVVKYSNSGLPLWTNRYNGPGNSDDTPGGMAISSAGTIFVTGASAAANLPPFGNPANFDYATVAYSNTGMPLWTNRFNGPTNNEDRATAIAVDTNGDVLVTGYSTILSGVFEVVTLKYSAAGVPLWTNRYDGSQVGDNLPKAIATDHSGNVFVLVRAAAPGHLYNYATVKYSSGGLLVWTNFYNGPGNGVDDPQGLSIDARGNCFVTGYSAGADGFPDFATIEYSTNGVAVWTNRYSAMTNNTDVATAIALDRAGNVLVTGFSDGTGTSSDIATIAYSNSGVPLSTNRYASAGNTLDQANSVCADRSGNVLVAGVSATETSGTDFTFIKYSPVPGPSLTIQRIAGAVVLSWPEPEFALQVATRLDGTFTNVVGASPYTNAISAPQLFFRLVH